MIAALLGVPGKLKTLLDRLTSLRAIRIDNLDNTITSRAPASTALSTAYWTNARAGYLDNLASAVPSSFIQSIQTGYSAGSSGSSGSGEDQHYLDITISAVVVAKSIVLLQDFSDSSGIWFVTSGRLTSTTNLRIGTIGSGFSSAFYGRWVVVEFK